jgi:hypothetical protein
VGAAVLRSHRFVLLTVETKAGGAVPRAAHGVEQMRNALLAIGLATLAYGTVGRGEEPDWASMPYTAHAALQAVNEAGAGAFAFDVPLKARGVIINDYADMLPSAPSATPFLGGMWQIYVQAVDAGDFGGTACWMGQNIGKLVGNDPNGNYTDAEWVAEIGRLTHDPLTGHTFQPGDLVEVRARAPGFFHNGKGNINEQHSNDSILDFDIYLLTADYGVPRPKLVTLAALKDAADAFLFDATRATGCEHYQGALVRVNGVTLVSTAGWGPGAELRITDGTRTFPVLLGIGPGFSTYPAPTGVVDVIGILDQEDSNPADGFAQGYRLWVMDYTGSGCILPAPFAIPGDANCDGAVNWRDIDFLVAGMNDNASGWQSAFPAARPCCAFENLDANGDGHVNWRDIDPFIAQMNS